MKTLNLGDISTPTPNCALKKYTHCQIFIALLFCFAVLSSCQIDKRIYNKGCLLSTKSRINQFVEQPSAHGSCEFYDSAKMTFASTNQPLCDLGIDMNNNALSTNLYQSQINSEIAPILNQEIIASQEVFQLKDNDPLSFEMRIKSDTLKTHWAGKISLISSIVAAVLLPISWMPVVSIGFLVLLFAGIVFGIIGIRQTKKYPEKYKRKGISIAGLTISLLLCALIITSFVVIASLFYW